MRIRRNPAATWVPAILASAVVVAAMLPAPANAAPGTPAGANGAQRSGAAVPAGAAPAAPAAAAGWGRQGTLPALVPPAGTRVGHHGAGFAPGENPPGRVTQTAGTAGYEVPTPGTTTVSTDVTAPSLTCHSGSNPSFGTVDTSDPSVEVAIGFDSTLQVATNLLYNCGANDFAALSTIATGCTRPFGLGRCPYYGFIGGPVMPGDEIRLTASLSPSASTSTITDLTSGAHITFTGSGVSVAATSTIVGAIDFCFLPGGSSETCAADNGGSPVPPPGYASYPPITFSSATIDGTGLGAYLAGPNSANWIEINDVWGATLEGQTSYVGSGTTFTDTNAQLTLPTLGVSSPRVDQPSSGTATLTFDATLSFASAYPIYVDYATGGGSAQPGTNYTAVSGTLDFPPGTTSLTVPVTVLAGPEVTTPGHILTVGLGFTNPSYVAGGASGTGIINEGPIVTSVTPGAVPLNGGPGDLLTVSGYDLSHAARVTFCPSAAEGGGPCIPGGTVSVLGDTSLTVSAPDATTHVVASSPTLVTDTIVTDTQGASSPVAEPADLETFGCQEQSISDGAWQAHGCMTQEPGNVDETQQASTLDGLGVSATPTDAVTYVPPSADVSSHGTVTVSLPLSATAAVTIFKGKLQQALKGPVSFSVPSGTKIAGIAISGTLTLTPLSLGKASGSVTATLPTILGGGTGTLSFTTNTGGTLSSVTIAVPKATFMQLFSLTNLKFAFNAPGTWKLSGTASTGATTKTSFTGTLKYAKNALQSGSLSVSSISLAGMVTITGLTVRYTAGKWMGSAKVKQAKQSASIAVTITGSTITAASFKTGAVPLFGLVNVKAFDLEYTGAKWSLTVTSTLSGGASASAALTVTGGVISAARIKLTKFALSSTVEIASASLAYAQAAPNATCKTVTSGTEIWCGSWEIQLPQATSLSGVSGSLVFADGSFVSGSVHVTGSVPLFDGVFLTRLGASLSFHPTVVGGTAAISFGPKVSGVSALTVGGSLTRTFPSTSTVGSYAATGTVTALQGSSHQLVLGKATVKVPDSGTTSVVLTLGNGPTGLSVSVAGATAKITGLVKGTFTGTTFKLAGKTTITVPVFGTVAGNLKADNHGIAACAKLTSGKQVGFEYVWTTGALSVLDTKGCTEKGF